MATLAESLKKTLYRVRAVAAEKGFRSHRLYRVEANWTGQHTGEGSGYELRDEITEGGGQPPRMRPLKGEEIALGNLSAGSWLAGPITPAFAGGGTDPAMFGADLAAGTELYFAIVGPTYPTGAKFRMADVDMSRPTRIMLTLAPAMNDSV